jgi:type IV pilus assembly protein PilA
MKNVKQNIRKIGKSGFSLVEMLVVIAVIGVIAAIAIPNIGNINDSARETTAQRNAQSAASVYSAGLAAGCAAATDKANALALLAGDTWAPTTGAFEDKVFKVPNLPTAASDADAHTLLVKYLDFGPNGLEYDPTGTP